MKPATSVASLVCLAQSLQLSYGLSIQARSTCSNFTQTSEYTEPGPQSFIVSRGLTCPASSGAPSFGDCKVDVGGYVTAGRTLNITTDSDSVSAIYATISDATKMTFYETTTWPIASQLSWPILNGTSGYIGFTPNFRCVTGTLSGCSNETLENVVVKACTPYSSSGDTMSFAGSLGQVTTTSDVADALTCDPANSTAAKNGMLVTNCSSSATSAASSTLSASFNSFGSAVNGGVLIIGLLVVFFNL